MPSADFGLWVCLHEATHRLQFTAVPWLRDLLRRRGRPVPVDGRRHARRRSLERLPERSCARSAARAATRWPSSSCCRAPSSGPCWTGCSRSPRCWRATPTTSWTPSGPDVVPERRDDPGPVHPAPPRRGPVDRLLRALLGVEAKVKQYAVGSAFTKHVVLAAGMDGFNRVWESPGDPADARRAGRSRVLAAPAPPGVLRKIREPDVASGRDHCRQGRRAAAAAHRSRAPRRRQRLGRRLSATVVADAARDAGRSPPPATRSPPPSGIPTASTSRSISMTRHGRPHRGRGRPARHRDLEAGYGDAGRDRPPGDRRRASSAPTSRTRCSRSTTRSPPSRPRSRPARPRACRSCSTPAPTPTCAPATATRAEVIADAIERGRAFLDAGAACVFVPGLLDEPTVDGAGRGHRRAPGQRDQRAGVAAAGAAGGAGRGPGVVRPVDAARRR